MPIGSSKVGLFGGKPVVPAGSETFNNPGTFVVPEGLEIVTVSGNGSTGNTGNPGGAGSGGASGVGGSAGTETNTCPIASNQNWNYFSNPRTGGTSRTAPGGPGLAGNPGNAGGPVTALGQTFVNGNGGNGGNAGNPGTSGNPGNTGNSSNIARGPGTVEADSDFGGNGGTSYGNPTPVGGTGMKARGTSTDNPPPINIQGTSVTGGFGGSGAGSSLNGEYLVGGCMPNQPASISTSPIPGGATGGGAAGVGVYAVSNSFCNYTTPRNPTSGDRGNVDPSPPSTFAGGAGGGGGGGRMAANNAGGWAAQATSGGGGGGASTGGSPGNAGNPGNSGTPATFNCVPTTTGSYPVQVDSGGQITISWNTQ